MSELDKQLEQDLARLSEETEESSIDRIKRLRKKKRDKDEEDRQLALDLQRLSQETSDEIGDEQEVSDEDRQLLDSVFGKKPEAKEPEGEGDSGFLEGVARGIREELAPFSYSEKELEERKQKDTSSLSIAGEVTGGIAGSIFGTAAAAKVGAVTGAILSGPFAPVGSVLGAGMGAVGYALYSGFGQEKLQASVVDQETSTARALARSALSLNPAARITGRAANILSSSAPKIAKLAAKAGTKTQVARAGAQVVGEAAVAGSTYGEEGAIAAGAAALILSPLVFKRSKGAPTPRESEAVIEFLESDEGMGLIARKADKLKEVENLKVSNKDLEDDKFLIYVLKQPNMPGSKNRVYEMSPNERKKAMSKLLASGKEGADQGGFTKNAMIEMYRGYKAQQLMLDSVKEVNVELGKKIAEAASKGDKVPDIDAFGQVFSWLADGQYIARAVDRTAGTNYTSQLNALSETANQFEVVKMSLQGLMLKAQKEEKALIKKAGGKLGKNQKQVTENLARLRIFISERDERYLTSELKSLVDLGNRTINVATEEGRSIQSALEKWDDVFETARMVINDNTEYFIPKVDSYITRKSLPSADLVTSISRSMQHLKAIATPAGVEDILKLNKASLAKIGIKGDEAQEILYEVSSLKSMAKAKLNIPKGDITEASIGALIKDLVGSGKARLGLGSELGAAMSRGDISIAPRFRMLNMTDVAMSYVNGSVRNAMFNKNYRQLSDSLEIMRKLGMNNAADWMQDHLDDTVGGLEAGRAKVSNLLQSGVDRYKIEVNRLFDNMDYPGDEFLRKSALLLPDLIAKTRSMIYPSYLALNVKAHIRDYGQVFLKAAPELAGWYGYKTAFKAYFETLRYGRGSKGRFDISVLRKKLQDAGVVGEFNITAEAVRAERPSSGKITAGYKQLSEGLMAVYGMGDFTNRAVTYNMGRLLAKDLARGDEAAIEALKNLGKAAKTNLRAAGFREALEEGDVDKMGDLLGKWLVPKTQFYYGAEQKSRFARFLGPTFSMFSKWPTSIGSELVDIWNENPGAYRKMKRYAQIHMTPLFLLSSIDYAKDKYLDGDEAGAFNYLIGDAKDIAPIQSLEFTIFNNPTIDLADYALVAGKEAAKTGSGMKALGKVAKKASKQMLGPVSAVMNEVERFEQRALGKRDTSVDELFNNVFGD